LHRKLWECLYLIVKKPRAENAWQFPQGGLKRGESIREVLVILLAVARVVLHFCISSLSVLFVLNQAAEREFEEECGDDVDYHTIANHPCGMHQYAYPADVQQKHNAYGARVFFLPALYLNGDIKVDGKEIVDYAWVTVEEMKDYLSPDLHAKVKQFLQ
jgi:large subunit ribosomal protein L46